MESLFGDFPAELGKYFHILSSDGTNNRSTNKNLWLKDSRCLELYIAALESGSFKVGGWEYGVPVEIKTNTDYSCLVLFYMYLLESYSENISGAVCSVTVRGEGIIDSKFVIKCLA
jgi:hypothetical protein